MMARRLFALLVTAFFVYVSSPLLMPVAMGALFAVLLNPLLEKLERKKLSTSLASLLLTLGVTLLLILPVGLSIYFAAKSGFQQLKGLKDSPHLHGEGVKAVQDLPFVRTLIRVVSEWYPLGTAEITESLQDLARGLSARAAEFLGGFVAALPGLAMALAVLIVSIYFLLVDGRALVLYFRRHSFFSRQQTDQLLDTLERTCRSVLLASLVSGSCQALFEFVVLLIAGVPNAVILAVVVFLSSFIPLIGTAPVTFGIAIHQFAFGSTGTGVLLLVSAIIVSTMDNFIRPMFLRGTVNLHPLLAFVAAFGGLQTLGFAGVFLGPIIAGLFVVTLNILLQGPDDHAA